MKKTFLALLTLSVLFNSCKKDMVDENPVVIQGNGSIEDEIDAFRQLLGPLNSGSATTSGRREVNWDAVPDNQLGKPLPNDFFNPTGPGALAARQRGLVYTSVAGSFVVSKSNFEDINVLAAGSFKPFSGTNTFANTSSSLWEVGFQVPGQATSASVRGFGAVFSDVDVPNESYLEFFNDDKSLGKFFIPVHDANSSFSFLGVQFRANQKVTRVVVSHPGILSAGQADISNGGPKDLIVLDDFLYSEPTIQP
ncbi:hypothetical protein [Flavitalea sp.]|nr:hypothetical protein [Flavitalea sp.]